MNFLGGIYGISQSRLYIVSFLFSPIEHKNAYYKPFLQSFEIVTASNSKEAKIKGLKKAKSALGNGTYTRVVVNQYKK